MPLTPYHFGPHALVVLPLARRLDLPAFLLANVIIDLEPLAVMFAGWDGPLHGYIHSFLLGGLACALFGLLAFRLRRSFAEPMAWLCLPYQPTPAMSVISAVLGGWLHIVTDAPIYADIAPLWPASLNPLYGLIDDALLYSVCVWAFVVAVGLYACLRFLGGLPYPERRRDEVS